MITVAEIAKRAFDGVAANIGGVVHDATVNAVAAGRLVEEDKKGPGKFPADTTKDGVRHVVCEGFTPSVGDVIGYAGGEYHAFWTWDVMASGGIARATLLDASEWLATDITFYSKTRTPDGGGGATETLVEIDTLSGHVMAVSGDEVYSSDRVEARSGWRAIIAYDARIAADTVAVVAGRKHNVRFVNDWERKGVWMIIDMDLGVAV